MRVIGTLVVLAAVAFVLVLNNDRSRFKRSRDVGCYLGLRPKQRDSGMRTPELGITKAGDPLPPWDEARAEAGARARPATSTPWTGTARVGVVLVGCCSATAAP